MELAAQFRSRATSGRAVRSRANLDAAGLFGRHFAIRWPLSVRKPPDNGCGVRKSPGGTGGTPRAYESRPTTSAAPRACPKAARKRGWHARQVSKSRPPMWRRCRRRFSPDATTTAPAPAVSRCAAVVLLRACRESALIPRGYERAHTGRSLRHRARGR